MRKQLCFASFFILIFSTFVWGQTISFTDVPAGYAPDSINLGAGFTGALAVDPSNPDIIYASVGYWQHNQVKRIKLSDFSVKTVCSTFFGSIGGLAVPGPDQLIVVDNDDYTTNSIPGETVLLCTDRNYDEDFDDAGEIEELISPILVDGVSFTGAQARIAHPGNPSKIPSGSLLFQNADGNQNSELFVVTDPTSPILAQYRPSGSCYFTGFDYNGGFDFDSAGRIFLGTTNSSWSGEVISLVNTNNDEDIDPGEWNDIVSSSSLSGGITDMIIDAEDDVILCTNPWEGYQVQCFRIPPKPLEDTVIPGDFADTDSPWLTTVIINTRNRSFEPNTDGGATLVLGGYAPGWLSATNLLLLSPCLISEVNEWELYI